MKQETNTLSELDETISEKVTHAEHSVRRVNQVHLEHIFTSACSVRSEFLELEIPVLISHFNFIASSMQDGKSFIVFRKSTGLFLECGSDDDFDLDEWRC